MTTNDEDLESLFDSIIASHNGEEATAGRDLTGMINQLGKMTRTLHDALRELGLNKQIEKVASSIPDARDRLNYVAALTQQAAERVLNATDAAQPLVGGMEAEARYLDSQWKKLLSGASDVEEFKALIIRNEAYLRAFPGQAHAVNAHLMEIMMAQDFQDLTGQVIKKITELTRDMEKQLLALLIENATCEVKAESDAQSDSVSDERLTSQDDVDALLGSLGF